MYLTKRIKSFPVGPDKHLVCNAITGEIIIMSDAGIALLETLKNGEAASCDRSVIEALRGKLILFASEAEEEATFLEVCQSSWNDFQLTSPYHYTFIVNSSCNFNCPYCFEPEPLRVQGNTISRGQIDAAFRIVDSQAAQAQQRQAPDFEIFGGEPLLPSSRPILEYLLGKISERGYAASVQTNGYYLSSFIDFFAKYQEHIRLVQMTLDGPKEIHDRRRILRGGGETFTRIVSGITELMRKNLDIDIGMRMNVDRENLPYLESMGEYYESQGWARNGRFTFIAAPVDNRCGTIKYQDRLISWQNLFERVFPLSTDSGGGPFDLSVFKIVSYFRHYFATITGNRDAKPRFLPKVVYCEAAALKSFAFHPDGLIYPCPETVGVKQMAIGEYYPKFILNPPKAELWGHQTILHREQCRNCDISTFCGGGCVLTALMQNNSMSLPICENAPDILQYYLGQIHYASQ